MSYLWLDGLNGRIKNKYKVITPSLNMHAMNCRSSARMAWQDKLCAFPDTTIISRGKGCNTDLNTGNLWLTYRQTVFSSHCYLAHIPVAVTKAHYAWTDNEENCNSQTSMYWVATISIWFVRQLTCY
jgi:hypothetical protein